MADKQASDKPADVIKFQSSIAGYNGPAVTLICALVNEDGVLVIADDSALQEQRKEGFGVVSNVDLPSVDFRFTDDKLRDAIIAFYARDSQDTIDLDSKLARHSPSQSITTDGIDERGPRFRLNADITNGQIAVLAACAFCAQQTPVSSALSMMGEMTELYRAFTI